MSLLTTSAQRFDRESEASFRATIRHLIDEALEAADDLAGVERICEEWDELLRDFRTLERETLLPREPSPGELRSHQVIYRQIILLTGLLGAAVERVHKISWNLEATARELLDGRLGLLEREREDLVFEYHGWHGPTLTPAQLLVATKALGVPV